MTLSMGRDEAIGRLVDLRAEQIFHGLCHGRKGAKFDQVYPVIVGELLAHELSKGGVK